MTGVLKNGIPVIPTVQNWCLIKWYPCHPYSKERSSYIMISLSSVQYRTGVLSNDIPVIPTVQDGCLIKW